MPGPHDLADGYTESVIAERAEKDESYAHAPDSPIPEAERASFLGLAYYPVDVAYRIEGIELEPYEGVEPETFDMPTSKDDLRRAGRAGTLRFTLGGQSCRLTAYDMGGGPLFVPFLDATSGTDTYGAGRYLDPEPAEDDTYTLDFNVAYHPYCAYNPRYSCPLTPAENRLAIRVEAGERLPDRT